MQIPPEFIVSIDETDVPFDSPMTITLARRGSRTIPGASTGSSGRATAILGVSLNGEKLPVYLIFKAKPNACVHREVTGNVVARGYPANVVMTVQDNAWCDIRVMTDWISWVWAPWLSARRSQHSYLMMDVFSAHMNSDVIESLEKLGTEV